jgi:hypothetical protein
MRKLAGREHLENGIERVDHDGETHVVKSDEIEVSQKERLEWYDNGAPGEDQSVVVKRKNMETEYDDGGNPMWVNEEWRTSLPRPHQYSIERRLQEERDPGSTYDITSDATVEQATAKAFTEVAPHVMSGTRLDNKTVIAIGDKFGLPVEHVLSLESIAMRNPGLVRKYAAIPGVVDGDAPGLEKESEPCSKEVAVSPTGIAKRKRRQRRLTEEELQQVGKSCGLCD